MPNPLKKLLLSFLFVTSVTQNIYAGAEKPLSSNLYERLGVSSSASQDEIKKAYKKIISKYHPDHNPGIDDTLFKNINEAYQILTDKDILIKRPGSAYDQHQSASGAPPKASRSHGSSPPPQPPPPRASMDQTLNELAAYFSGPKRNAAEESRILVNLYSMDKYQLKKIWTDQRYSLYEKEIFTSSAWKDQNNRLFEIFVSGWGLASLATFSEKLALLVSSLDPNDPRLRPVLYDYNFSSPGRDFIELKGRRDWMLLAGSKLLLTKPYSGTQAGQKLLNHMYEIWQQLKSGSQFNSHINGRWAIEMMKLIETNQYKADPKVLEMVGEIPTLLSQGKLGLNGYFTDAKSEEKYQSMRKARPELFSDRAPKTPLDEALDFYSLTAKEQNARPSEEAEVLRRLFSLSKYEFESAQSQKPYSELIKKIAARPIWGDESNGLIRLYIEGWGLASSIYAGSALNAKIFSQLDPNSPRLQRIIYSADISKAPGRDFADPEKRLEFMRPILTEMLREPTYLNTEAGQKLIQYLSKLWKDIRPTVLGPTFWEARWMLALWKTLEVDSLRENPTMRETYKSIHKMVNSGGRSPMSEFEMKEFKKYSQAYFEPPTPNICRRVYSGN